MTLPVTILSAAGAKVAVAALLDAIGAFVGEEGVKPFDDATKHNWFNIMVLAVQQ